MSSQDLNPQQLRHFENLFCSPLLSTRRRQRRDSCRYYRLFGRIAKQTRTRKYQQAAAFKKADAQLKTLIEACCLFAHYPIQTRIAHFLYSEIQRP